MVALSSSQVVQFRFPHQSPNSAYRCSRPRTSFIIKCRIAEPTGEPAPLGQKTKYIDGFFEKAFMTLFARKMEKFADAPKADCAESKKKGWFDYDYDSFVDVSRRVMQGRNRLQQQEVVREVLLSMLPPGAPEQVGIFLNFQFNNFIISRNPQPTIDIPLGDYTSKKRAKLNLTSYCVVAVQEIVSTYKMGCRI